MLSRAARRTAAWGRRRGSPSSLLGIGGLGPRLALVQHLQSTPQQQQRDGTAVPKASLATAAPAAAAKEEKKSMAVQVKDGLSHAGHMVVDCIRNPKQTWESIKKEAKHYWVGTKLLWAEVKIAREILTRLASGRGMTRRERMQLIRTATDVFRLVPFAIFVIVPFMELLLPVALKLFPNMLPSTFQDKLKKEEGLKMELQMRLAVAGFFQETLTEMANKKRKEEVPGEGASAGKDVLEFIEKARLGEPLPNETVIRIAGYFKDELTLANINRPQLVSMCQYMGLPPFGADAFLRFQLRTKLRRIKEDDRRILWEGIDSLTVLELREACNERGMRTIGLSEYGYKRQLQEWLDLSIQKNLPISLLIMSRAFMLTSNYAQPEEILKSSISSLDSDTVNEVVLAVAKPEEESSIEIKVRKLESLEFQSDMIREERDDKEEAMQAQMKSSGESSEKNAATKKASSKDSIVAPILAPVAPVIGKVVEKVTAVTQAVIKTAAVATGKVPSSSTTAAKDSALGSSPTAASTSTSTSTSTSPATAVSAPQSSTGAPEKQEEAKAATTKELSATEMQILGDLARGPSLDREKAILAKIEARVEAVAAKEVAIKAAVDQAAAAAAANLEKKDLLGENVLVSASSTTKEVFGESMEVVSETSKSATATNTATGASVGGKGPTGTTDGSKPVAVKEAESKPDPSMARMQSALNTMVDKLKNRITDTEKALTDKLPKLDTDGDGELTSDELKGAMQSILKRAPTEKEAEHIVAILDKDGDGKVSVAELVQYAEEKVRKSEVEELEAQMRGAQAADKKKGGGGEKAE